MEPFTFGTSHALVYLLACSVTPDPMNTHMENHTSTQMGARKDEGMTKIHSENSEILQP